MSYSVPVLLLDQTSLPSRRSSQLGSRDLDLDLSRDPDPRDMEVGSMYVDQGSGYPSRRVSDLDLRRRDHDPERVKVSVVRSPEPYPAYLGLVSPGLTDLSPRQGYPSDQSGSAHTVPQYGHAYEDWNWPIIRRVVTGLTVAAVVALVSAVIALVVIHSQICYPRFHWWQGVTVYRADPETFNDKDEDGRGDFVGMKERLEYVKEFGAGVLMLETVFDCVNEEGECMITDHNRIKPSYGDFDTLFELTTEAHRQGLHVLATVPAGYTSRQHAWYQASRRLAKTSRNKFTDYYVWSDDADPELPSAFDQVRSQFYLYHGTPARPLLNYNNSHVREDVEKSMVRLLRVGVHGFFLENLDKIPLIDEATLVMTMRHLREAADHYDNAAVHRDEADGHYPRDRCLMVPEGLMKMVEEESLESKEKIYQYIDLVDTWIRPEAGDVTGSLVRALEEKVIQADHDYHPWPCWNLGVTSQLPSLHAAMLIQAMTFPGTICLHAGQEIGETDVSRMSLIQWNTGSRALHWIPYSASRSLDQSISIIQAVREVVRVRAGSLAVRSNGYVRADVLHPGFRLPYHLNSTLLLLRHFPRQHDYLTIVNYSPRDVTLDLSDVTVKADVLLDSETGRAAGVTTWERFSLRPGQLLLARQSKWSA